MLPRWSWAPSLPSIQSRMAPKGAGVHQGIGTIRVLTSFGITPMQLKVPFLLYTEVPKRMEPTLHMDTRAIFNCCFLFGIPWRPHRRSPYVEMVLFLEPLDNPDTGPILFPVWKPYYVDLLWGTLKALVGTVFAITCKDLQIISGSLLNHCMGLT